MKHTRKTIRFAAKFAACFFALFFSLGALFVVFADTTTPEDVSYPVPTPLSECGLIYNLQYERVLFQQKADVPIYPASFAKVMSALLAYEYRRDLGTNIAVTVTSDDDLSVGGLGLEADEITDYDALLSAMVVGSANDAANVLARVIDGSIPAFVEHMNRRAGELGCTDTVFQNPTGLHAGGAQTTLNDMAKICAKAYEINDYMQTASLLRYEFAPTNKHDKVRILTTSNLLLNPRTDLGYYVKGAMGINHGSTPQSGNCVCSVRETGGAINLILVSGGYRTESKQNTALLDAKEMFDYAEKAFEIATVLKDESVIQEVPVRLSDTQDHILLIAANRITALLPVGFNAVTDIEQRVFLTEEVLEAPIVEGTAFGSLELYYKGELIGQTELVAQHSLARSASLAIVSSVENFLQHPIVRMILFILAALLIVILVVCVILLIIHQRKKSGLTAAQRRAKRRLENELIKKEKARQEEYIQSERAKNLRRFQKHMQKRRLEKEKRRMEQEEEARRERERARRAQARARTQAAPPASSQTRPNAARPSGPVRPAAPRRTDLSRPAEGCEAPIRPAAPQRRQRPSKNEEE